MNTLTADLFVTVGGSARGACDDANRLTEAPKVVFSRTPRDATWATTELIDTTVLEYRPAA